MEILLGGNSCLSPSKYWYFNIIMIIVKNKLELSKPRISTYGNFMFHFHNLWIKKTVSPYFLNPVTSLLCKIFNMYAYSKIIFISWTAWRSPQPRIRWDKVDPKSKTAHVVTIHTIYLINPLQRQSYRMVSIKRQLYIGLG